MKVVIITAAVLCLVTPAVTADERDEWKRQGTPEISESPDLAEIEADLKILRALDVAMRSQEDAMRHRSKHMKQLLDIARKRKAGYIKFIREKLPADEGRRTRTLRSYREWTDDKLLEDIRAPGKPGQPTYRDTGRFDARILRLRDLMHQRGIRNLDAFDKVLVNEFGTSLERQKQAFYERYLAIVADAV